MILWTAEVRRIFPGHPGVPRLEEHSDHLPPEIDGADPLEEADLTHIGTAFVLLIPLFEGAAIEIVEVRDLVGREEGPLRILSHALHEEVGDPIRRMHIVSTTSFIPVFFRNSRKSSISRCQVSR